MTGTTERHLARRHVEDRRRRHLARRHLRSRDSTCSSSAPASRRPGTAGCAPATISTAPRPWRSTPTTARSSGTSRPRRTTAGTSTASTSSSRSSSRRTARRSRPAPRPTATASSSSWTATNGKLHQRLRRSSPRSPGPRAIGDDGRPICTTGHRGPRDPDGRRPSGKEKDPVFNAPSFLGAKNWMPMAYSQKTGLFYVPSNEWGMDIWNEPITYKKGAAYLGAGFNIKPLYEDHIGVAARDRSRDRRDQVRGQEPRAALGRGADHRRRPRLLRHARGLPAGRRRQDRRDAVEVPTPARAWSARRSPGSRTASSTSPSSRAGAAPCRSGAARSPQVVKNFNQGGSVWAFKLVD